ncbi:MAG: PAC2 family protein [Actinobacteria bacterium]|nr:PAC2 family protein [Actinomycetota bacterium]
MEIYSLPSLRDPILIAAFQGWNDAGEAASKALAHLLSLWPSQLIAEVESEDFYDYQVNRPQVFLDEDGERELSWPTTTIYAVSVPDYDRDLIIVTGVEPSMRWRSFVGEILSLGEDLNISLVVSLGSLLADVPHTRPIPVTLSVANSTLAKKFEVEISRYEGPTGILGAIQDGCNARDIDSVSLWAAIPHYVSAPPCPKATLALINHLEDLLQMNIDEGELPDDARAWELGATQITQEDSEISEYVQSLEESKDAAELPEASGESIAREFERYLRHRGEEKK